MKRFKFHNCNMDINTFLDNISRQIEDARDKIIKDNQQKFESLVLSTLKKGDVLYVANGTSSLIRGNQASYGLGPTPEKLQKICDPIDRGCWDIGFDFEYKTAKELNNRLKAIYCGPFSKAE